MLFDTPGVTLAYPFKRSKLNDRELEVSIHTMLKFFTSGELNVLIVGDQPRFQLPSFAVHVPHSCHPEALKDAIRKIEKINSLVPPGRWIYCHDDQFAVRPFALDRLDKTVLYTHVRDYQKWNPVNNWGKLKRYTMKLLGAEEVFDTATHMPRVFETNKVTETLNRFRRAREGWDFQIAYDHLFTPKGRFDKTEENRTFLRFERDNMSYDNLKYLLTDRGVSFVNCGSKAFTPEVERCLMDNVKSTEDMRMLAKQQQQEYSAPALYDRCKHKAADTGQFISCGSCPSSRRKEPVFFCAIHGVATVHRAKKRNKVYPEPKCCIECLGENHGFELNDDVQPSQLQNAPRLLASSPGDGS